MKMGLVGYAGSGKSTVFEWLTGEKPDPSKVQQGQTAMADVPDERLAKISAVIKPKKTTYTKVAVLDTPGLMADERKDNPRRLGIIREANGMVVVLDGFYAHRLRRSTPEVPRRTALRRPGNRLEPHREAQREPEEEGAGPPRRPRRTRPNSRFKRGSPRRSRPATPASKLGLDAGRGEDRSQLPVADAQAGDRVRQPRRQRVQRSAPGGPARARADRDPSPGEARNGTRGDGRRGPPDVHGRPRRHGVPQGDATIRAMFYGVGRNVFFTTGEDECRTWSIPAGCEAVEAAGLHPQGPEREVRPGQRHQLRRLRRVRLLGEGSEGERAQPHGREDLHRQGRRHHAHPGEQLIQQIRVRPLLVADRRHRAVAGVNDRVRRQRPQHPLDARLQGLEAAAREIGPADRRRGTARRRPAPSSGFVSRMR